MESHGQNDYVELAKAARILSHPLRLSILKRLMELKRCYASELVDDLGLKQGILARHLYVLSDYGLITSIKDKSYTFYEINTQKLELMREMILRIFDEEA